jgi:hypothetical protein
MIVLLELSAGYLHQITQQMQTWRESNAIPAPETGY